MCSAERTVSSLAASSRRRMGYGVDSLIIDEENDFKQFLENNRQYWDYVNEELLAEKFVIDRTPPLLEVLGVKDGSANREDAVIRLRIADQITVGLIRTDM